MNEHFETVKLSLKRGADFYVLNEMGETPFQESTVSGY